MSQADIDVPDVGWVSDSVIQQIQEQSVKYGVDAKMSGYVTLPRPTELQMDGLQSNLGILSNLNTASLSQTNPEMVRVFRYLGQMVLSENILRH